MNRKSGWGVSLLIMVLVVGAALGAPRPARADNAGSFLGGMLAGALLDQVFDRDYPQGVAFTGQPVWNFYPQTGVYCLPTSARNPYGQRCWTMQQNYRGRPVYVPVNGGMFGPVEVVRFGAGMDRPIFVGPTYLSRLGARWDTNGEPGGLGRWWFPATFAPPRPGWDRHDHPQPWRWDRDDNRDLNRTSGGWIPDRDRDRNALPAGGGNWDRDGNPGRLEGSGPDRDRNPGRLEGSDPDRDRNPGRVEGAGKSRESSGVEGRQGDQKERANSSPRGEGRRGEHKD